MTKPRNFPLRKLKRKAKAQKFILTDKEIHRARFTRTKKRRISI